MLAAKILKDLGVKIHGVHFALPWGCGNLPSVKKSAQAVDVPLKIITADASYFELLKNPRFGYGSAINPCVDCHIHMIKKAVEFMREIHADFVFTGEVLGQRPMSQLKNSLRAVERNSGIEGYLLRPLCAKLLPPTIPEEKGLIDRTKLFAISGRGRQEQHRLAKQFGFKDFPNPAGGCLLTDKNFARRLRDAFQHNCHSLEETIILKWGRHFRLGPEHKAIVGRDDPECELIAEHAKPEDYIFELDDKRGPAVVLQGKHPSEEIILFTAGLTQAFSRYRNQDSRVVEYYQIKNPEKKIQIKAPLLTSREIELRKL